MVNGWKVTAIIAIILLISESLLFWGILSLGYQELQNEEDCAYDICDGYGSYRYISENSLCECYGPGDEFKQTRMGNS